MCDDLESCVAIQILELISVRRINYLSLSFYLITTMVLLNLVVGIFVESFMLVTKENEEALNVMQTRCFICDLTRADFEKQNADFDHHVKYEHNMMSYMFYYFYLTDVKDPPTNTSFRIKN